MGTSPAVMTARQSGKSVLNSIFGNTVNAVWIDEFDSTQTSAYPRNEKVKFKGDPLALVLAYRENGMENWKITEQLTSSSTWDLLATKEHVQRANDIKKYYRNRFVINVLKNGDRGMSKFRQDLREYVESEDPYSVYKNDIPMIVKLPDFYEEDRMMDEFVKEYRMDAKHYDNVTDSRFLIPMKKHHRKTKRSDQLHFWFRDINDLVYRISIEPKNPLLHLFEREFAKDKVCLSGTFYGTKIRGQDYTFYSLNHWKFV